MLVLTRKLKEQIVIGDNIRITVAAIKGNQVRLGIEAPDDVVIRRQELCFETPLFERKQPNGVCSP